MSGRSSEAHTEQSIGSQRTARDPGLWILSVAGAGELNFNLVGVIFQSGSIVTESFRLCLIQILLQVMPSRCSQYSRHPSSLLLERRSNRHPIVCGGGPQAQGIKLNPVTTLYYIAPACFAFLCVPFTFIEYPKMSGQTIEWNLPTGWLLASACSAFGT
jgi:hypothetical protein